MLRDLSILKFISYSSKILPRPSRWFTICENLFCTSSIVSPCFIFKVSYSWMREFFWALLTSSVPSCVTWIKSHISFVIVHADTLKNSLELSDECIMFVTLELYSPILISGARFIGFLSCLIINYLSWNFIAINNNLPYTPINKVHGNIHANLPKRIVLIAENGGLLIDIPSTNSNWFSTMI